jgi:DNA-binding response OmpR family regulator
MSPHSSKSAESVVQEEISRPRASVESKAIELLADVIDSLKARSVISTLPKPTEPWSSGDLEIDVETWTIRKDGEDIPLTRKEFELIRILVNAAGAPVPRKMLWSKSADHIPNSSRSLDAHIWSLRKKLETSPGTPRHILTVIRYGYRLV